MKKLIFILLIISILGFVSSINFNEYYKLDLNYNQGEFSLNNLNIEFSDTSIENYFGFYLADVIDSENESLNLSFFDVPNEILYDEVDENGTIVGGGLMILNETNFTIYVPYYENANQIIIYDENLTEKLRIDISMYSTDEEIETSTEEEQIAKEEAERKEQEKEAETFSERLARNWWIFGIILLVLVIILIRSFVKKSK